MPRLTASWKHEVERQAEAAGAAADSLASSLRAEGGDLDPEDRAEVETARDLLREAAARLADL